MSAPSSTVHSCTLRRDCPHPSHTPPDNRGKGSGDWECFSCGALHESLKNGFSTRCDHCGSYELHLSDAAKARLR